MRASRDSVSPRPHIKKPRRESNPQAAWPLTSFQVRLLVHSDPYHDDGKIEKGAGAEARKPLTRPADAELSRRHLRGDLASIWTPSIWSMLSKNRKSWVRQELHLVRRFKKPVLIL